MSRNASVTLPIYEGHQPSRHPGIFNAQLVNLYVTNKSLAPVAGIKQTTIDIPGNQIRGQLFSRILNGIIFVSDTNVFFFDGTTVVELGIDQIPGLGFVKIVENFNNQIAFLSEGEVFIYNTTTKVFAKNTVIGALVQDITFQDSYFFFSLQESNEFKLSGVNDGLSVEQDFSGLANGRNVAIAALEQQIWVFTNSDINIFFDTGSFPNIYAKSRTLAPNYGCLSKLSVSVDYGRICWLGTTDTSSPFIATSEGARPTIISNENLDFLLDEVTDPTTAIGLLYQLDGHIFYHIYFPSDNFGIVYDFETKVSSKITYQDYITSLAKLNNIYYATLVNSNKLYEFDVSITEENGICVNRYVMTPTYFRDGKQFGIKELNCYMETGFSSHGSVELYISRDKGVTFNEIEVKTLPPIGEFGDFVRFLQLGSAYFVNFMLRFNVIGKFALRQAVMKL